MEKFINRLRKDYPSLTFKETGTASWSPGSAQISYSASENDYSIWSTLHELGHALMGHQSYKNDVDLLNKEVEAWDKAMSIARGYGVVISREHIQDCLDTYRDWVHRRSACPSCGNHGLQNSRALYRCINCPSTWKVSSGRFCRSYRLKRPHTM